MKSPLSAEIAVSGTKGLSDDSFQIFLVFLWVFRLWISHCKVGGYDMELTDER